MPISDTYIVRYLLQATQADEQSILWREQEDSSRYHARIREIELELETVPGRSGARLYLTLSCVAEKVHIAEPVNIGILGRKYRNPDQEELARLMRELSATISRQCAARRNRSEAMSEVVRQNVYRRLISLPESEA